MPIFQFLLFRHIIIVSTLEVFFQLFCSLLHHHPEFNNNHVKARETRKSIKFSFSSPSIAFLCFFLLVCCLFIISLVGLLDCITFFLDVCTFVLLSVFFLLSGSATATIRSGSLTFNHSAAFDEIQRSEEENEKRVTSQGYNKTTIFRSISSLLSDWIIKRAQNKFLFW